MAELVDATDSKSVSFGSVGSSPTIGTPASDTRGNCYSLEWGGEYENSGDAQSGLAGRVPIVFAAMVLIVIALFNSLKTPLVI